jgi:Transcriptional Coactivator p15 (PC4)
MNASYEIRFGGHLWRVEATSFNSNRRVSIWPFYAAHDGSIKPGKGGLQIPIEEADAFAEAVVAAAQRLR